MTIEKLKGKKMFFVEQIRDRKINFYCQDGHIYEMLHTQDCCESVSIEDVEGDLEDLAGSEILLAEERHKSKKGGKYESATWTFYTLATIKGYVTIRWFGESNGYYSEKADIEMSPINTAEWRDKKLEILGIYDEEDQL